METIGETLTAALAKSSMGKPLSERLTQLRQMSPEDRAKALVEAEQRKIDRYNASEGHLNDADGYDCPLCKNRGNIGYLSASGSCLYPRYPECKCMDIRRSILRMKQSGLETSIRDYTFQRFEAREPWQNTMLDKAKRYLSEGVTAGQWLFMGGQPGCGKTHICTAVAGKLLYERPLWYVVWPQVSKKLKALAMDAEEYEREIVPLQEVSVLFVDDFFKPTQDDTGRKLMPTPADTRIAFEILNYRYINKLPTIISSEWHIAELVDMDEATGSRIAERASGYCLDIGRDRKRKHRLASSSVV